MNLAVGNSQVSVSVKFHNHYLPATAGQSQASPTGTRPCTTNRSKGRAEHVLSAHRWVPERGTQLHLPKPPESHSPILERSDWRRAETESVTLMGLLEYILPFLHQYKIYPQGSLLFCAHENTRSTKLHLNTELKSTCSRKACAVSSEQGRETHQLVRHNVIWYDNTPYLTYMLYTDMLHTDLAQLRMGLHPNKPIVSWKYLESKMPVIHLTYQTSWLSPAYLNMLRTLNLQLGKII